MKFLTLFSILFCLSFFVTVTVQSSDSILDDPLVKQWMAEQSEPIGKSDSFVQIKNGTIRGTTLLTAGSQTMYAYLGIPYAKPPVGELRFQPPQTYDGWGSEEILNATTQPHSCPQWLTNTTIAEEDCLFISVYSKRAPNGIGGPLPVMFWIHGGGFLFGQSSQYTGYKVLVEDVVFVAVQYRLGPLGFLSTGDEVVPGNMGMKDMVKGLRWVQENIANFGGDPTKVTVMGESAGAAASTFMLISPIAQGLFNQVAALSGTAIAEWSMDRDPKLQAKRLAEAVNCTDTSTSLAIVSCLKDVSWQAIAETHLYLLIGSQASQLKAVLLGTSPVIEPDLPGAFLTAEPLELFETGPLPNVPILLGAVQNEGSLLLGAAYFLALGPQGVLESPQYVHDKLIGDLLGTWGVDESVNGASVSQALSLGFLPPGNPRNNFTEITYEIMDMLSVLFMKSPVYKTAEILSRRLPAVYFYSFEHSSRTSLWNLIFPLIEIIIGGDIPPFSGGITHADDLMYMFNFPVLLTLPDIAFSRMYVQLFVNYAIYGTPTPSATEVYPVWPTFTVENPRYYSLNGTPTVGTFYPETWRRGLLPH